ncbi:MAG: hypothetical protein Q4D79_15090 [Propionibacteriaceae bacterium]|nr:hypothetical protein [Propionibacteriaceae bacterium]
MKNIGLFVLLVAACLFLPILLAAALSSFFPISSVELTILYGLVLVAAILVWRSATRRNSASR